MLQFINWEQPHLCRLNSVAHGTFLFLQAKSGASRVAVPDRAGPSAQPPARQHRLRGHPPVARHLAPQRPALGPRLDPRPRSQRRSARQAPRHRGVWQNCGCASPPLAPPISPSCDDAHLWYTGLSSNITAAFSMHACTARAAAVLCCSALTAQSFPFCQLPMLSAGVRVQNSAGQSSWGRGIPLLDSDRCHGCMQAAHMTGSTQRTPSASWPTTRRCMRRWAVQCSPVDPSRACSSGGGRRQTPPLSWEPMTRQPPWVRGPACMLQWTTNMYHSSPHFHLIDLSGCSCAGSMHIRCAGFEVRESARFRSL